MAGTFDLVVQGGVVVTGQGMARADVGIQGETIAALASDLPTKGAKRVLDATGRLVLPGIIDVHVHPVYLDNIHDASISAAFGGTTTMIHYAYARPGMKVLETIKQFRDDGLQNSLTDFGLHAGLFDVANQIEELPGAFKLGVTSFKVFLTYAKLKWMTDDYWLMATLDVVGQEGGLVAVHAENGLAGHRLPGGQVQPHETPCPGGLHPHPSGRAGGRGRQPSYRHGTGCRLPSIHPPRQRGQGPGPHSAGPGGRTGRVRRDLPPVPDPHRGGSLEAGSPGQDRYLTLTEEVLWKRGAQAKIGPPLRTPKDIEGLWQGIQDGIIDTIATDHAPKAKEVGDDFFEAPYGSPQAETLLTVTYDAGVNAGRISVPRLVQLLSETPARIFGYYPRKGTIAPGADADLVLFDPAEPYTIEQANQHSQANYTLYEGREGLGRPVLVMQRGRVLIEDGKLVGTSGQAKYLPTQAATQGVQP